jgi:hypothetical protein
MVCITRNPKVIGRKRTFTRRKFREAIERINRTLEEQRRRRLVKQKENKTSANQLSN